MSRPPRREDPPDPKELINSRIVEVVPEEGGVAFIVEAGGERFRVSVWEIRRVVAR